MSKQSVKGPLDEHVETFKKELRRLDELTADRLVEIARVVGEDLKVRDIKLNQIRRFLDGVRKVEADLSRRDADFSRVRDKIVLLQPKLAYAAGRHSELRKFAEILEAAVRSGAEKEENFWKLLRFIEGVIAYHRFYGGKES
ncbi:type III-A CRISPR-associated protein Csm2 [Thermodesulforhabdus norvegica]|uniref:CRISPR system Cms protein Csm2 n=1 Tax=Thermodesulforhabdus norvegica TaxID=39841 RepID=A0A1I4TBB1_9BACT|nr:type III-A CRISPR-associated protein Csm2 [Thermodesulforhabdus norvegica]SFM73945.1 CRISPR-associated protein Csm2 [Thermodesulforhabdus norvegica]